jgi:hypothetical protein
VVALNWQPNPIQDQVGAEWPVIQAQSPLTPIRIYSRTPRFRNKSRISIGKRKWRRQSLSLKPEFVYRSLADFQGVIRSRERIGDDVLIRNDTHVILRPYSITSREVCAHAKQSRAGAAYLLLS